MLSDYEIGYALSAAHGTGGPGPDLISKFKDDPFMPNDLMDWIVGGTAVLAGYAIAARIGGPVGLARYASVAPDIPIFAGAVALSNLVQSSATHRGGRYSTTPSTVTSGFMMV